MVVVDSPQSYTTDCLGDVGPVRTCHASSMESSTSYRAPPPRPCMYLGITRTRNFCKFCRAFIPVPGTSVSSVRQCHEYRGYGYSIFIPARNFCKFLYARATKPGTSGSSVRLSHPYPELLEVLYNIHTRTRNFCELCTPRATIPGYGYTLFVPARNFCKFCTPEPHYPELL